MSPVFAATTIDPSHPDIISPQEDALQGIDRIGGSETQSVGGGLTTFVEPVVSGLDGDRHCQ